MNETENGSVAHFDGSKNTSRSSTTISIQESELFSPSRRSKRLQKEIIESKGIVSPSDKNCPNEKGEKSSATKNTNPQDDSYCSTSFQCQSSEYLFGLYDQDMDTGPSSSHKFYGCKRKGFPSPCSESFGLPDDPIFSNSPIFHERTRRSPLDIDLADPWDISVMDLENIDKPWLVQYPEVITPYWDVESLLPFEIDDIRQKMEPEFDIPNTRTISSTFSSSSGVLDASDGIESESESVFTSTPLKNQNNSLSVISTINLANSEDNNVNLAALKEEVIKALEQAIKQKSTIGNIDMKIQIVSSDLKSPATSPKKSHVEVRINENVETASCRSSSSSKENYFIENAQGESEKSQNFMKNKELSKSTVTDLKEDWQDSQESDVNESVQGMNTKKGKSIIKNKKKSVQVVRRSLRFSNSSTTNNHDTDRNSSTPLVDKDNSINDIGSSALTKNLSKTSGPENQSKCDISKLNLNIPSKMLSSKRTLRSGLQASAKTDLQLNQSESICKTSTETLKSLPVIDKVDSNMCVGTLDKNDKFEDKKLPTAQSKTNIEVFHRSKRMTRQTNGESISGNTPKIKEKPKNTDSKFIQEGVGKNINNKMSLNNLDTNTDKLKSSQEKGNTSKNTNSSESIELLHSNIGSSDKISPEESSKNPTTIIKDIPFSQNDSQINKTIADENNRKELHVDNSGVKSILENSFKGRKKGRLLKEDLQSSQDESDTSKNKDKPRIRSRVSKQDLLLIQERSDRIELNKMRSRGRSFRDDFLQSSQDESDSVKDVFNNPRRRLRSFKESLQSSQDESDTSKDIDISKSRGRPRKEDIQLSQDESDIGEEIEKVRRRGRFLKETSPLSQVERDDSKKGDMGRRRGRSFKEDLQTSQDESDTNDTVDKVRRRRSLRRNFELSQDENNTSKANTNSLGGGFLNMDVPSSHDESDTSKDIDKLRKKERQCKSKVQRKPNKVSTASNQFTENQLDSITDLGKDNNLTHKKILRSKTTSSKVIDNDRSMGRRRTFSTSTSDKSTIKQTTKFPARKRSVSANFDSSTKSPERDRRSLRSHAIETMIVSNPAKSPYLPTKSPESVETIVKSSKISFNLDSSFKESPKPTSPIKSILKNVYDTAGKLIGVKIHREKHVMMPSALEIKPEEDDDIDNMSLKTRLKSNNILPAEMSLDIVKKEEENCLRENGITSRIKIVISPFDIKEEIVEGVGNDCPILPLAIPKSEVASLRKSGRLSNIPLKNSSEKTPEKSMSENIPQKNASEKIPEKSITENILQKNASENTPVESKSQSFVKENVIENISQKSIIASTPQKDTSENIPEKNTSESTKQKNIDENTSQKNTNEITPQKISGENILKKHPSENTKQRNIGKNTPQKHKIEITSQKSAGENNSQKNTSRNIPVQNDNKNKSEGIVKAKINNGKIDGNITQDVKIEQTDYNLGDFVWAQVSKYPFWPSVICFDPITQTFQKEVLKLGRTQIYYHLRFFGDHGRRAWVSRRYIMLYCSKEDLERIANKLKSENKNREMIKPYLLTGSQKNIQKWHKATEELESLRNKTYEDVIAYLLKSFENYLIARRKRKWSNIDGSSESESEENNSNEKKRRKQLHITADTQLLDSASGPSEKSRDGSSEDAQKSEVKQSEKRSRRSVKAVEALNIMATPESVDIKNSLNEQEKVGAQNLEVADKVTPRRSKRSLNVVTESLDKTSENIQELSETSEIPNVSSVKMEGRRSIRTLKSSQGSDLSASQSGEPEKVLSKSVKKQPDEGSEAESKMSSDACSSNPNMYSFEYQLELHKKNFLFNGLTKVRVCDYCCKQGDIYKCKGKCGGYFHLECASKVTQPHVEKRARKREKSPSKAKVRSTSQSVETTPNSKRIEEVGKTENQDQVQIITIKSKHAIGTPKKVNLPANFDELSLSEQIDYGMKEMMSKFENRTIYLDSTDSSSEEGSIIASKHRQLAMLDSPSSSGARGSEKSVAKSSDLDENGEEEKSLDDLDASTLSNNTEKPDKLIKHVTADSVILTENETPMDFNNLKCTYCRLELDPPCFACGLEISKRGSSIRRKCSQNRCGRYYHPHCLKMWPQTQWSIGKWSRNQEQEDCFTCPAHSCHTCFSEELGSAACRLPGDKLARCMLCPAGFHTTSFCIPAGSEILGGSQIICPRHRPRSTQPINTVWCFICSEGGNLICCDTCPTSVHPECQPINLTDDDKYICEDCESGRFPLYDEIVWVKLGQYRWWPAIVLFPNEIPENVKALKHQRGDFAVKFFGTNDHYWVNKARSFLFQEGDQGGSPGEATKSKNKVYETFGKAIEDAALAYKLKKEFKLRREAETINSLKPPTYVKINKNRPVGNVKLLELDISNATACECDPNKPHPCGPDSSCINRLLMTECDPDVCPAGTRCRNQAFQKREYPPMVPYKTQGRGWGLKCLAPIKKGQFVIEYVGELIDSEEYQRRIQKMHEQKEENYYFMTVDSDRMIDAGPKGNLSRFMNHCCNPNCVTQKWTVRGDTRVGLFAKCDIDSGSELTFNYNLEVVGQEKKVCKCGASNCSGFIGVKAKSDKPEKSDAVAEPTETRRPRKYNKKRAVSPPSIPPCFMCGRKQSDLTCNNKFCNKGYHLKCLKLEEMPEVSKFTCPRHNCNICSNRTIRCCVKCTNSFCPSHSDGNVRHDKFLGFVCRLHDPDRSEFEPVKLSIKRRRQKADSTDDSTVSSTTSDEESTPKTSLSLKTRQKEASNAEETDIERNEPVSSSPQKEFIEDPQDSSEEEFSVERRFRRKSGVRNPRKKIRVNVKSLVSTAKTSNDGN